MSNRFNLIDRIKSFKFAIKGIRLLMVKEHNARVHLVAGILVLIAGVVLKLSPIEFSLIIICVGFVFVSELFNTSVEAIADFVEPKWNEKIGEIKDYAAGAVLVSTLVSVVVGLIIFGPKLLKLLD